MAKTPSQVSNCLLPWEVATHVADESRPGLLSARIGAPLTLLLFLLFLVPTFPLGGATSVVVALVFARLAALDLTTYTLPNVYTLPLLAVGLAHAFSHGHLFPALYALVIIALLSVILSRSKLKAGVGGGDLKLLAVMFAFLTPIPAVTALAVGCVLWLPFTFLTPRQSVPFGVPLILGWLALIACPNLPEWLFSSIS